MASHVKKIVVFTGNRAEYGILQPVIEQLGESPSFDCHVLISGTHIDGSTTLFAELSKKVTKHFVAVDNKHNSLTALAINLGNYIQVYANTLSEINPDMVLIYGDRTESFAALLAAAHLKKYIVHIEGGDVTAGGTLDDNVRHAMTKLSHIHFATNNDAYNRLIQMGEEVQTVYHVGSLLSEYISRKNYASIDELLTVVDLSLRMPILLFTLHPVLYSELGVAREISICLDACRAALRNQAQIIFTAANNDFGGDVINDHIRKFVAENDRVFFVPSLGRYNFHGVMSVIGSVTGGACIGNSSGAIKEAIFYQCPVINIGDRQRLRLAPQNVLHVPFVTADIEDAITKCLSDSNFRQHIRTISNPYAGNNPALDLVATLQTVELNSSDYIKTFVDARG